MSDIDKYKQKIIDNLNEIQFHLNDILSGNSLDQIEPILLRIDRLRGLPIWFTTLKKEGRLPNLDGKTVGSVIEKVLVCVLEKYIFCGEKELNINPARGVDIPELELGVKSPSTNYDTSEPYFSAYERLLGNEYDAIILLTNYQTAKRITPFNLQILDIKYLHGSEIADIHICTTAKFLREKFVSSNKEIDELSLQKLVRFLAYVNKSDWEANAILKLIDEIVIKSNNTTTLFDALSSDFNRKNARYLRDGKSTISEDCLERILSVRGITPLSHAVITAAENWVLVTQKDNGRYPNENEWHRFLISPLNGKIGMSFALQWRYNFRALFNV